jgi:hypothetical protein
MTKNYTHIQTERKSRMITVEQWERINMILENPNKYSVSTITLQLDEDGRWVISTHRLIEQFEIDTIENKYIEVKEKFDEQGN